MTNDINKVHGIINMEKGEKGAIGGEEEELQGVAKRNYQTQAARANYLCLDRPDIGFATKDLCRDFSNPTERSVTRLK